MSQTGKNNMVRQSVKRPFNKETDGDGRVTKITSIFQRAN